MSIDKPNIEELLPRDIPKELVVPQGMRLFTLYRTNDETGVSGTGIVLQGVLFANQKVCIQWLCAPDPGDTQVKDSWEKFLDTHVRSHPANQTLITWQDGTQDTYSDSDSDLDTCIKQ